MDRQRSRWVGLVSELASRRVRRGPYVAIGVGLALSKVLLDNVASQELRGEPWSPWNYLVWPFDRAMQSLLNGTSFEFPVTMLAIAVPFAVVGLAMTAWRLRDAGLPVAIALGFLVPLANLAIILLACAAPSRRAGSVTTPTFGGRTTPPPPRPGEERRRASPWILSLASLAGAGAMLAGGASGIMNSQFGYAVFFLAPALGGMVACALTGLDGVGGAGRGMLAALLVPVWCAAAIVLLGLDGLVCVLMALPIMLPLVLVGAFFGVAIQRLVIIAGDRHRGPMLPLSIALGAATLSGAAPPVEGVLFRHGDPPLRRVVTDVIVDAPIETVWSQVIAFPSIAPPTEWLFRAGIAYPTHATIVPRGDGSFGPGSIRECVFSTGAFVEPITIWDPPRRLAFDVTAQPAPMRELSPWEIHPDHLDEHLTSRRGEFLLEALPDGRTRLTGTTWYEVRMWPQVWWGGLSDAIIHRIHRRVLGHVRDEAAGRRLTVTSTPLP